MDRFKDYGIKEDIEILGIISLVCSVMGNGKHNNAKVMLEETIRSETQLGAFPDNNDTYGEGLGQFDKPTFVDVLQRTKPKDKMLVAKHFGIDLTNVYYSELRKNPILAILMVRLKYKLIEEEFPTTKEARYHYYKRYYNSASGKADLKHYLESNKNTFFRGGV